MARAPARLKQIQLRLDETLSLSRGLENHLNPELPHAHESALTQLRRRDPTTTGTHDAQPLQPLDRSKKTSKPRRSNVRSCRISRGRHVGPRRRPGVRIGIPDRSTVVGWSTAPTRTLYAGGRSEEPSGSGGSGDKPDRRIASSTDGSVSGVTYRKLRGAAAPPGLLSGSEAGRGANTTRRRCWCPACRSW